MGLMDNTFPQLLESAEKSTTIIRDADLVAAAFTTEEANKWKVEATDFRYILINICSGAAATTCRQHQSQNGFEIYRQLCVSFSIPLGARSIIYLIKLLKPTFDMTNFEEAFSQWEFEPYKLECDNGQALPESVRATTTTLAAASRTITNLQHRESNDNGVLQSNTSIQQVETTNIIKCERKSRWRKGTHGHLSN